LVDHRRSLAAETPNGETQQPGAFDKQRHRSSGDFSLDHVPHVVVVRDFEPCGDGVDVVGSGEGHGHPAVDGAKKACRAAAAPIAVACESADGRPFPEQGEDVELHAGPLGDRRLQLMYSAHEAGRRTEGRTVGASGECHAAARRPGVDVCARTVGHTYSDAIAIERLSAQTFLDVLRSPFGHEDLAERGPLVFVDTDDIVADDADVSTLATCPIVVAGNVASPLVDVPVDDRSIVDVARVVNDWPIASVALAVLLRAAERRSVADGLVAESAVYSLLQGGPEFTRWRETRPVRSPSDDEGPAVRVEREGERLVVTLSRPHVHNAFSAAMRDELVQALAIAQSDPSVTAVVLEGDGPSFSSGGDLDEFGSRPDPATAHLVRLERSPARAMAAVGPRSEARLHGACLGAGIELAAFAGRVVATPDAAIGLPEVTLGLIPGAGCTVSVTRRIGRHRTALLALTGTTVDAATASQWGLVDEVLNG